jgi:hypothetical protein
MIRAGQPHTSSDAVGKASTPAGQPRAEQGGKEPAIASQKPTKNSELLWMDWRRMWEQGLGPVTINEHRSPGSLKAVKTAWLREQGDWNGANEVSEGWVLLEGRACEIARAEARLSLQQACKQSSIPDYLQSLRQRGHVGLANRGLAVLPMDGTLGREPDERRFQDQVNDLVAWLDWSVRFVRPTWETNVTTWNMGPMGCEYSRTQLQQLLARGQAIVMAQEVRFPLGARQRVKRELKHLHPEYHCFLEAGKDSPPSGRDSPNTEGLNSPWCNRGHFAVATFLHREIFKSAQRREWHVDADRRTLKHMTRGRVLRVEAELHDGQRMQIFNVHQATSGDVQLQQHTWQILAKSVAECKHQRILLGGDLNASASGTRVGYAESNAEHMAKVDALLENFVHETQGELMSPSTCRQALGGGTTRVPSLTTSSPGTFPTIVTRAPWGRVGGA